MEKDEILKIKQELLDVISVMRCNEVSKNKNPHREITFDMSVHSVPAKMNCSRPQTPIQSVFAARIDEAIHRMETGYYGYCVLCGAPISLERLEWDPTTAICGDCASKV